MLIGFAVPAQADERRTTWLSAHNAERAEFGVLPLSWSDALAAEARDWAEALAHDEVMRTLPTRGIARYLLMVLKR